jgi:hypothetical protein
MRSPDHHIFCVFPFSLLNSRPVLAKFSVTLMTLNASLTSYFQFATIGNLVDMMDTLICEVSATLPPSDTRS